MPTTPTMQTAPTARTRRTFATLLVMLTRSTLREPVGLFFTLILAPLLVAVLGVLFGNDPSPQFGGRGFMDATLPACACLVVGMTGIIILPTNQLQLRESGALTRLRATPLSPRVFVAADLTVNFLISMVGIVLALLVGALGFGVRLQGSPLAVLAAAALGLVAFLACGHRHRQRAVHRHHDDLRGLRPPEPDPAGRPARGPVLALPLPGRPPPGDVGRPVLDGLRNGARGARRHDGDLRPAGGEAVLVEDGLMPPTARRTGHVSHSQTGKR